MDEFGRRVCAVFGLDPVGLGLQPLPASSTRLWALRTRAGRFAVKEFPYDRPERAATLAEAAEFEYSLWRAGQLLLPEPVRAPDGRLILRLAGSAGTEVTLRVHRWLAGSAVPVPPPAETAAAAGVALAQIQHAGLSLGTLPVGTLRWWTEDPRSVLRRMRDSGLLTAGEAERGSSASTTLCP